MSITIIRILIPSGDKTYLIAINQLTKNINKIVMNKLIHSIQIKILEKDENNLDQIRKTLSFIFPVDIKKEKIEIKHEKLDGLQQNTIHSISLTTTKERHNKTLSESFLSKITDETKETLLDQIDSRLDEQGNYFIRFDKQSLFKGIFQLTDSGDCFHLKIKIAAFPAKKEHFKKTVETLLKK
jgi:RNA binding exosome subunit